MNANVTFRHMESSSSLRSYATKKLEHVCEKYVQGQVDATIVFSVEKFWHVADFTLQIKNLTVKGSERTEDMYSSIDLALAKIEKQLRRHKDRLRDHKPSSGTARLFKMGVISTTQSEPVSDLEIEYAEDFELYPAPEAAEVETATTSAATNGATKIESVDEVLTADGAPVRLLRNSQYQAVPMTIDEAALQLDLLQENRQFFVFTNTDTNSINVIYRRDDNNLGLIET